MPEQPCAHGMPGASSCVDCMNEGNLPAPRPAVVAEEAGPEFEARFPGQCTGCNLPIMAGQRVRRLSVGDHHRYVHARCAQ